MAPQQDTHYDIVDGPDRAEVGLAWFEAQRGSEKPRLLTLTVKNEQGEPVEVGLWLSYPCSHEDGSGYNFNLEGTVVCYGSEGVTLHRRRHFYAFYSAKRRQGMITFYDSYKELQIANFKREILPHLRIDTNQTIHFLGEPVAMPRTQLI